MSNLKIIKNIVFSSGALGGIAFIGVIKALEEHRQIYKIQGISGCSIGSVIALLFSIGYNSDELTDIALQFKHKKYMDIQVLGFLEHCGLDTGKKIIKYLSRLIEYKTGLKDLTFEQHWNITGRVLWINSSCIDTNLPDYYSVKTSPKMSVLRAVRRSITVPFLFTSEIENGIRYIDGGYHDSVPASMFPVKGTVCFIVRNNAYGDINGTDIHGGAFFSFCMKLLMGMHTSLNVYRKEGLKTKYNVVEIFTGVQSLSVNLKRQEKKRLILTGYNVLKNML